MAEQPTDDQLFGAIDLIINVLKDHEANLDNFTERLEKINEKTKKNKELIDKIDEVTEKIVSISTDLSAIQAQLSKAPPKEAQQIGSTPADSNPSPATVPPPNTAPIPVQIRTNRPIIMQCRHWSDFQVLSTNADTITFSFKENERILSVDALKGNQIITYKGSLLDLRAPLRCWLSKQINIPETRILEGALLLG